MPVFPLVKLNCIYEEVSFIISSVLFITLDGKTAKYTAHGYSGELPVYACLLVLREADVRSSSILL